MSGLITADGMRHERAMAPWHQRCFGFCGVVLLAACAALGPGYEDVMANAESVDGNAARLVFLRPRARDDGSNGGPAVIHIGEERTGELRYGSFFTFKLKLISEESALAHLEGLGWSK